MSEGGGNSTNFDAGLTKRGLGMRRFSEVAVQVYESMCATSLKA